MFFPCACSVKQRLFKTVHILVQSTIICIYMYIFTHKIIFIFYYFHIFIFSFIYMYFHVHILENVMYASQNSTQCKLNPDIILHLVAIWESCTQLQLYWLIEGVPSRRLGGVRGGSLCCGSIRITVDND